MGDSVPGGWPPKLRVAFTESNIFNRVDQIPEDSVFTRSSSVPKGNSHAYRASEGEKNSWRSSLDIRRGLKNSFTLGFLFPDDGDDDELCQSFLTDSSDDSDVEAGLPAKASLQGIDESTEVEYGSKAAPRVGMHRAQTAPAMSSMNRGHIPASLQRPDFTKGSDIVILAGTGLILYLAVGVAIFAFNKQDFSGIETLSLVDALYFCVVTMCTIGYGDIVPVTPFSKLFTCLFVLIGFGFIDALLSGMVTYVLDKQEHLLLSAVEGSHFRQVSFFPCSRFRSRNLVQATEFRITLLLLE